MNRRHFIKAAGLATAAVSLAYKLPPRTTQSPKLAFSTLGCPAWDLPTILKFAAANQYQGVELRVIANQLDLPNYPDFSQQNMPATRRMIQDNNLVITDIGASTQLHHTEPATIAKNLDEAKAFIELAHRLNSKYIRVFPEKLLPGNEKQKSLDTIAANLNLLGNFAKGSGVKVLLETHGDLIHADDLVSVISQTAANNTGLIWDVVNMWSVTKEPPAEVFRKLQKYIFHVHVKDATFTDNKERYVLLGKGQTPIKEAIQLLHKSGYKGYYSFEWEKLWHPEIEEPEVALAAYPATIKQYCLQQ